MDDEGRPFKIDRQGWILNRRDAAEIKSLGSEQARKRHEN
jgi:hypothetical protein